MKRSAAAWSFIGIVAGLSGLATSYLTSTLMNLRLSPVTAVAELVIRLTPGNVAERAVKGVGTNDKPLLVTGIVVFMVVAFAVIGLLARRRWWLPVLGFVLLAAVGVVATMRLNGAVATDLGPILVGFATWMIVLSVLTERLQRWQATRQAEPVDRDDVGQTRRTFLTVVGAVVGVAAVAGVLGRVAGGGRRRVEQARRLLRLPVTAPNVPASRIVGVEGTSSWMTSASNFYLIDTAVVKPTIEPKNWSLRIHGMVDKEVELTYADLVNRPVVEAWITLNCVSNYVGGSLIGNAWWSGIRLADLLEEAGLDPEADAILQTSEDGWTCGTPIDAVTDGRNAMLAVAMNGEPLAIEHGFPVRTIIPGLYGYVSGCKWVVDMEVTKFSEITAFWTDKGWGEMGPVKMSSRIEVPRSGDRVRAGEVTFAGTAWSQHTGVSAVEVAVDGGRWQPATLAGTPSVDCWVQWKAVVDVDEGEHLVRVRATDKDGLVQTGVVRDVLPDGATGWHSIDFHAKA